MNSINPDIEYPKVERMLHNLAWRAVERNPYLSYEDCLSQTHLGFMMACERFDPRKGSKFSSYCYYLARFQILALVVKTAKTPLLYMDPLIEEELAVAAPPKQSPCMEVIAELSYDAQDIVGLLLETPEEILAEVPSPCRLLKRVLEHLSWTKGKNQRELRLAVEEIQFYFRRIWSQ